MKLTVNEWKGEECKLMIKKNRNDKINMELVVDSVNLKRTKTNNELNNHEQI